MNIISQNSETELLNFLRQLSAGEAGECLHLRFSLVATPE
jgi:hypothetical protein